LAAILPFLVVLQNGFLDFDDGSVILEQPFLREPAGILQCLWPFPYREEPLLLRDVTYWLSFQLHGEWAPGFSLVDLALHALCAIGVWALGKRVFSRWSRLTPSGAEAAALAGAFLFAVHPIHVESVAWLSARKDVLSGVFYLAGACAWLDYLGASDPVARRRSYLWTGVFYLGALGSKSGTVSFPLVLVAADLIVGPKRSLKDRVLAAAPFVILTAVYVKGYTGLLASFDATRGTSVLERHPEPVWKTLPLTNAAVLEQYLWRMVLPLDQRVFSSQTYRLELSPGVIRALIVCSLTLLGSIWLGWRERPVGFLLAWIPLALAPFMNVVATGILYAERYVYLSSIAVCLLLGAGSTLVVSRLASRLGSRRGLVLGLVLALLAIPASLRASHLARAFKNDGTLWTLVLEREPENYIGLGSLANWYGRDLEPPPETGPLPKDFATRISPMLDGDRAEELYARLIAVRPTTRNARRYGRLLERRGRLDEALGLFKTAIGRDPKGDPKSWLSMARIYLKLSARADHRPPTPGEPPVYSKALKIYDYVERTFPKRGLQAGFQRAQALEFLGQRDAARAAWAELLSRFQGAAGAEGLEVEGRAALERLQ
jgi:protein O-mannosyl-transferase